MSRPRLSILSWLFTAACCPAVEAPLADLRLVGESRPTAFTYEWSHGASSRSGDDAFAAAWGCGLGLRYGFGPPGSPHQLVVGTEALRIVQPMTGGSVDGWLGRVEAGWAYSPSTAWLATLTAGIGVGTAELRMPGVTTADLAMSGSLLEAGIRAGVRWQVQPRLALGCELGWLQGRDRFSEDGSDLSLRRSGPWLAFSASWVLDRSPRLLDRP